MPHRPLLATHGSQLASILAGEDEQAQQAAFRRFWALKEVRLREGGDVAGGRRRGERERRRRRREVCPDADAASAVCAQRVEECMNHHMPMAHRV
jgi:hypothetical protein